MRLPLNRECVRREVPPAPPAHIATIITAVFAVGFGSCRWPAEVFVSVVRWYVRAVVAAVLHTPSDDAVDVFLTVCRCDVMHCSAVGVDGAPLGG